MKSTLHRVPLLGSRAKVVSRPRPAEQPPLTRQDARGVCGFALSVGIFASALPPPRPSVRGGEVGVGASSTQGVASRGVQYTGYGTSHALGVGGLCEPPGFLSCFFSFCVVLFSLSAARTSTMPGSLSTRT